MGRTGAAVSAFRRHRRVMTTQLRPLLLPDIADGQLTGTRSLTATGVFAVHEHAHDARL
jgi:hypothetical protein